MSIELTTIGVLASLISTLLGAITAALGRRISKLTISEKKSGERDFEKETRLSLVTAILMREIERCKIFRVASSSLVFSQFVIGGVLTSSFVTKNLSEGIVGILGLIVLASSLINQHFRPDLLHKISAEKLRRLRSLKRRLEDKLYVITRSEPTEDDLVELRLQATRELEEIEASEYKSIENEKQQNA